MANIASLNIGLSANSAKLSKDLDKARARTKKFGKGAKKDFGGIGSSLKGVAGLIGGLAIGAAIKNSVQDVREFSKAAAELSTLGFDDTELKSFTESARELSTAFGSDSVGQVNAYYQAVSAGASNFADAQKVIEGANKLALGGVTDIETATDGLTTVLNAYGLETSQVDRVSDVFFATMKAGKTTVDEISRSIGKVAPLASGLGLSFEETGAAIAQITKSGINTSEAVSGLKAAFANITKPSKQAKELSEQLGIAFDAQTLASKGLIPFIQDIAKATGGNVTQMSQLFGSIEGVNTVLAVARGGGEDFAKTLDGIQNSSGATAEAVTKVQKSFDFQLSQAGAEFKELSLVIGETFLPLINSVLPKITGAVSGLANLIKTITSGESLSSIFADINFEGLGMRVGKAIGDGVKFIFSSEGGKEIATSLFNAVKAVFSGLGDFLIGIIKGAFDGISLSSLFEGDDGESIFSGFSVPGFANGGDISGAGTGTSDSIMAMLSDGEFVVNAKDAKNNLSLLNAINSGGMSLPGFVSGGQVKAAELDAEYQKGYNVGYLDGYTVSSIDSAIDWKTFDEGIDNVTNWSSDPYLNDPLKFNKGGIVPGSGNMDTVPAMLTPGEIVLNKSQQEALLNGGVGGGTQVGSVNLNVSRDTNLDQLNEQMINKWGFGFAPRQGGLI